MKTFFRVVGRFCTACAEIAVVFPSSLYRARKACHINDLKFKRYVVCRKCHRLYFLKDSISGTGIARRSTVCPYKAYPNHPHRRMRTQCWTLLLKTIELASGRQALLNRPGFSSSCEEWRSRRVKSGVMDDEYDGKIWNEFQCYNGQPYLSQAWNLALMMNFDFFQLYKHTTYSVGAIYCIIMNLPRTMRYKTDNVILVGLIPGHHEPRHNINTFLEPLVNELMEFWEGCELKVHSYAAKNVVRCMLVCCACDLPAGRKACGFLGHSAKLGCSHCLKKFATFQKT